MSESCFRLVRRFLFLLNNDANNNVFIDRVLGIAVEVGGGFRQRETPW
jgi:hypothetical protein